MTASEPGKAQSRIRRFLSRGPAQLSGADAGRGMLLDGGDRGTISVDRAALQGMVREGQIRVKGGMLSLSVPSPAGCGGSGEGFQEQHRDLDTMTVDLGAGPVPATVNWSESPLGQLMRRRTKDGAAFLSSEEYGAGERLRADFTRGHLMPRLGANWVASVASGRRDGGIADLTDAALAARHRVEAAIVAVGPELSGILIDVCCFLKGMELVEMERGWPARSAKVVLKAALGTLGRHYDPGPPVRGTSRPQTLHWGADDYRPSIGG